MAQGKILTIAMLILYADMAMAKLNPLITKQTVGRIRYVSEDGKVSIFQKRNGELSLSTNFAVYTILSGPEFTNYLITASRFKKYFLIEKDEHYLRSHAIRREREIYRVVYGGKTPTSIGKGINPKLHYQDTWASFYRPTKKIIMIKSLVNNILSFNIQLKNPFSVYFTPEVMFIDNNRILYTDLNEKGQVGLFLFERESRKVQLLYKNEIPGIYLEFCKTNDKLYLGEFPHHGIKAGSQITEFDLLKQIDYGKGRILYESGNADLGNMICTPKEGNVYFIKTYPEEDNFYNVKTDIVGLNPAKGSIKRISDIGDITNIILMDERILTPYRGEFLIVKGDPLKDDSLK